MPRGPKGERRPVDVIGNAVKVMRIATGEEPEDYGPEDMKDPAARALGKRGAKLRHYPHEILLTRITYFFSAINMYFSIVGLALLGISVGRGCGVQPGRLARPLG
jgi:hypothetical protein